MSGRLIWMVFFCTALVACRLTGGKARGVLEADQMTTVIWDLVRVDEYAATRITTDSTWKVEEKRRQLYQQVFQLHKIDAATFKASYQYYESKPEAMRVILDSISARQARAQNQHSNQQPKPTIQAY